MTASVKACPDPSEVLLYPESCSVGARYTWEEDALSGETNRHYLAQEPIGEEACARLVNA